MKNFKTYLAESERTYRYRIKMVGDVDSTFVRDLKDKLAQFDPVSFGTLKTTPVQLKPADFPACANERVSSMDVEFRYPAIEPQIKQLAQILGMNPNHIIMLTGAHEDSMDQEREKMAAEGSTDGEAVLEKPYPAPDKEQRDLSKDYSGDPYKHAVLKNAYRSDFTVAGGKTAPAETTNDLPMGVKSPMTKIVRPPRPATGANPRG